MASGLRSVFNLWMGSPVDICKRLANNSLDMSLMPHPVIGALEVSTPHYRRPAAWHPFGLTDVLQYLVEI